MTPGLRQRLVLWFPRAGLLAVVGLWLWLPLESRLPAPAAGAEAGDRLVPVSQITDPAFLKELEGMDGVELELRNERDSVLFRGTPAAMEAFVAGRPELLRPADEPLLPAPAPPVTPADTVANWGP